MLSKVVWGRTKCKIVICESGSHLFSDIVRRPSGVNVIDIIHKLELNSIVAEKLVSVNLVQLHANFVDHEEGNRIMFLISSFILDINTICHMLKCIIINVDC